MVPLVRSNVSCLIFVVCASECLVEVEMSLAFRTEHAENACGTSSNNGTGDSDRVLLKLVYDSSQMDSAGVDSACSDSASSNSCLSSREEREDVGECWRARLAFPSSRARLLL